MTSAPRLWKDETQVNLIDAGRPPLGNNFQGNADIAAQPNGGYLVVWSDGAHVYKNGYAIVARTYDSAGNFTRGDFLVSDDPNSDDTSPAVAVLSNGDIAVAYEHNFFENNIEQEDLDVKVYDPALHLIRTDFIQNEAFVPSLTARAGGGYVVSYTEFGGGRSGVEAQIISPPNFEPRVNINPFGLSNAPADGQHSVSDTQLATLSNGWFVGAFKVEDTTTSHTDIGYSIFTNTGAQVVYDARVPFGGIANTEPDVAALRDGGFVVAWSLESSNGLGHVFAEVLTNTGAFVNAVFVSTKSTAQTDQFLPNVVGLDDGGFLVTWQEDMAGGFDAVRGQRFDAIGHKIGDQFFVSVAIHPEATVLDDGRIAYAIDTVAPGNPPNHDVATSIFTTQLADSHVHDFNDDGSGDLLWRNDNGAAGIWELRGGQVVGAAGVGSVTPDWHFAATGDFNGDAQSDILWQNDNGAVGMWELRDGQVVGTAGLGSASADWHIATTGDFDGDGHSDILWHNDNGTPASGSLTATAWWRPRP
jgi:FG-GAP-like repeat